MKILIAFLSLSFLYACSTSNAGDNSESDALESARLSHTDPTVTEVGTTPVVHGDFPMELVSNGLLGAREKAVVPFRVQEQITDVNVQEGDRVKAGMVLGRVESFNYRKQLNDARNQYEKALIDLEDLLLGHGYVLTDTASMPANILKMTRIRSGYNSALSNLTQAKRNLAQTVIKAPISGVVSNLQAKTNNPSGNYKMFCEILDIDVMELEFHLLETEIQKARTGRPVDVIPFGMPNTIFKATVVSINPAVNDKGMVRITARLPNPGGELMDGMNARVLLKEKFNILI
jgi:multidrug efflux pump subunit AcrA (membrane-fusion protein)